MDGAVRWRRVDGDVCWQRVEEPAVRWQRVRATRRESKTILEKSTCDRIWAAASESKSHALHKIGKGIAYY